LVKNKKIGLKIKILVKNKNFDEQSKFSSPKLKKLVKNQTKKIGQKSNFW